MITFDILARVFQIRNGNSTATAFAIDYEGRQYLVTAWHVFPTPDQVTKVELLFKTGWKKIEVNLTGQGSDVVDVVVFSPSQRIADPDFDLPLTKGLMILGQDVYFLGFPYGMISDVNDLGWHLPYPLVKKACLSGAIDRGSDRIWLLDGINNHGFSGGPVVFYPLNPEDRKLRVMGVVSGFKFSKEPLYVNRKKTKHFVKSNTGIVYATCARHIIQMIENNPNGLEI